MLPSQMTDPLQFGAVIAFSKLKHPVLATFAATEGGMLTTLICYSIDIASLFLDSVDCSFFPAGWARIVRRKMTFWKWNMEEVIASVIWTADA